jgi:hypothetical protein
LDSFSLHFASGVWWVCALALIAGIGLSIWTYQRTIPRTTASRRRTLIALRSVALALLLFVLFQPILTVTKTQDRSPRIAVLLDNSRSMLLPASLADTSINRLTAMKKTISTVFPSDILSNRSAVSLEMFSEQALKMDTTLAFLSSSLKGDGAVTDISSALSLLSEQQKTENIGAVVLFSDGAYTAGSNPLYAAEHLGVPIFTVGIGDSTERRDAGITNLFTNEVATIGAAQPVDITVHSTGTRDGEQITVSLFAENEKIDEERITLKAGTTDEQVSFNYTPKQEGSVKLTAKITALSADEATSVNNIRIKYIKVLKNTFKIVLFAGAPSSDVSFVKDYFNGRKEIEFSTFIQKQGAEFYEGAPTYDKVKNADLVILCGFPISSSSTESVALVKRLVATDGHSLLFIPSRTLDPSKVKVIEDILPFSIGNGQVSTNELNVSALVNAQSLTNPILRADKAQTAAPKWESLAPLVKTETHFAPKAESQVLAEATLQGVKIGEPLLMSRTVGKSRQIAFTGYGLWKWKLTSFGRERAFASLSRTKDSAVSSESALDIFLGNATRWLVMRDENKRVRIEPTQRLYDAGESIEFTAQIYDESFVPVDQAIVAAKITGGSLTSPMEITLEPLTSGRYSTKLPQGLAKGEYSYSGVATADNQTIGTDGGRFNVGDYSIEFAEPRMRSDILREMATRSGGKFYTPQTSGSLMVDIKRAGSYTPKRIEEKSEFEARMSWYILGLAIALFGTEWLLRKRSGML